ALARRLDPAARAWLRREALRPDAGDPSDRDLRARGGRPGPLLLDGRGLLDHEDALHGRSRFLLRRSLARAQEAPDDALLRRLHPAPALPERPGPDPSQQEPRVPGAARDA